MPSFNVVSKLLPRTASGLKLVSGFIDGYKLSPTFASGFENKLRKA